MDDSWKSLLAEIWILDGVRFSLARLTPALSQIDCSRVVAGAEFGERVSELVLQRVVVVQAAGEDVRRGLAVRSTLHKESLRSGVEP